MNWLLLRGLMREADHWGDFKKELESSPDVKRVICLDLPGVGTESKKIFIPTIKHTMEDIRSRFQHLKGDEEWGIVGISLGGMVAMKWVDEYPHDFKKIVVINTSSKELPPWKRLTPVAISMISKIFIEKDIGKREKQIIEMTSNLKKHDLNLIDKWTRIARRNSYSKITALNQMAAAAQFSLPKKIKIPMLVLASRADRMVNYECSKLISEKYKAEIKIHSTAGHDIPVDDSKWVVEQISTWN